MKRFYLPPDQWREPYTLSGPEAKHMLRVMRLGPGDRISLFDGQGREGVFSLVRADKNRAELKLESETELPRPESSAVLALGWAKSSRRGWLMEKSVELEAEGVWFWQAERSQGRVPEEPKETWAGQIVAGAKQCGNPWLPELRTLTGGARELAALAQEFDRCYLLWEEQDHERVLAGGDLEAPGRSLFVLGPEGGLSQAEVDIFTGAGMIPVSLGKRVLRWETAALLCLGLSWWSRQHRP